MKYLLGVALGAVMLAACSSHKPATPGHCARNEDCAAGSACKGDTCFPICNGAQDTSTCPNGTCCREDFCQPCADSPPVITAVNGTGSADTTAHHGSKHLRDRLVIEGQNLATATVTLALAGSTAPAVLLEPCGDAQANVIAVALPLDVTAGRHILTVANLAGQCSADLTLLQGEFTGTGVDLIASINTTMAADPTQRISRAKVAEDLECAFFGGCVSPTELTFIPATKAELTAAIAAARPQQPCVGAYKALQWDGTSYSCVDVRNTGLSGGKAQGFEVVDSWGYAWDGALRPLKKWAAAEADCVSVGGRLPTTTELFRMNSTTGTADVGDINSLDYLWTRIRFDQRNAPVYYYAFRLSDGAHTNYADNTAHAYRCVWPNRVAVAFEGNQCYGPPGGECFAMTAEGGRYNVDSYDRPVINVQGAMRECAFYHGHLATELMLTEAIQTGLPNGSAGWVNTSDHEGYNTVNFLVGLVQWTNVNFSFADAYAAEANWGYVTTGTEAAFRCAGFNYAPGPHPTTITNQWTDTSGVFLKSTSSDEAAGTFGTAVETCRARGGHLPTERDYSELIQAGLTNGSNVLLWTSDQEQGNAGVVKWTGTDLGFTDEWTTYTTWSARGAVTAPYRCAYYPVDSTYTGPVACNTACFQKSVDNGVVTTMWADDTDRTAAKYGAAVSACYTAGGHLATHRDMVELIHAGLPNGQGGTGLWVWTSDLSYYTQTKIVRWTGLGSAAWSDAEAALTADGSNASNRNDTTTHPYRCVWTNELRW